MDSQILRGNRGKDQLSLDGLATRCVGNQLITAGTNSATLTLAMFNDLIDMVEDVGYGRVVFTNKPNARALKTQLLSTAGGATVADVTSEIFTYEGVKVITVGRDENNKFLLDFSEKQGTSSKTSSMYCIAPGNPDEKCGVVLLMASNSIEVIEQGIRGVFHEDLVEVAFGMTAYDKTAIGRLSGLTQAA